MFSNVFTHKAARNAAPQTSTASCLPRHKRIVVAASGAPFSQRAIKVACRMGGLCPESEIRLVYLIEVPRAFALNASLPGEELLSDGVLTEGAQIVEKFGCQAAVSEIQRGRDIAGQLLKYLTLQEIDLLVLGSRPDNVRGIPLALARDIYNRAPCRVILDYIAGDRRTGEGGDAAASLVTEGAALVI